MFEWSGITLLDQVSLFYTLLMHIQLVYKGRICVIQAIFFFCFEQQKSKRGEGDSKSKSSNCSSVIISLQPWHLTAAAAALEIDSNKRTAPLALFSISRLEFSIPKIINALVNHDNFSGIYTLYPKTVLIIPFVSKNLT